ncbi:MAG: gluconeogenesis factor YvcK family protein [Peptoniphilus sp.]|nr:gluconeogenesis factor YvcK family protein [Peptoniphilus sp.]MDY3119014.1 gluconeogenesis factor YvcK family protein [Peptoniphilus sp.]
MDDPKFVVLGGGTGISVLLRGLKRFSEDITAIVTMADDGGSSGMLRREYGMLPPGDVRNCLVALANAEPSLKNLLQYRFKEGDLKGQNMGNLIITALTDVYGGFAEGVREAAEVLKITGRVLPVTEESIVLIGHYADGSSVRGESAIPKHAYEKQVRITSMELAPRAPKANKDCIQEILSADLLVLGPGSLYTSLVPNLLVPEVAQALNEADAPLVYVANMMEQRGETEEMSLTAHLEALRTHGLKRPVDSVLVNDVPMDENLLKKYESEEGVRPIRLDAEEARKLEEKGIHVETGAFMTEKDGLIRHDGLSVAQRLLSLCDRYGESHCKG